MKLSWTLIMLGSFFGAWALYLTMSNESSREAESAASRGRTTPALARALPGVPLRRPLSGFSGLIDTGKAREELGFTAQHSWRDYSDEAIRSKGAVSRLTPNSLQ